MVSLLNSEHQCNSKLLRPCLTIPALWTRRKGNQLPGERRKFLYENCEMIFNLYYWCTTLSNATTRSTFRISKLNESRALEQKLLPCMAHMMYAFLLMNWRNFSKHQKKHFMQHRMARVNALSYFFRDWSMYSRTARIIRQIATSSEPKATVPRLYL